MADKEFTYSDVAEHTTKKDLYMVIHDKVYDTSSFVDEHPYVIPLRTPHRVPAGSHEMFRNTPHSMRQQDYTHYAEREPLTLNLEVVRKSSSTLVAKTRQKPSRMSATQTRPARSSRDCSSEP
jgi:hypothetical protein